ncbi:MAG TPA: GNAT family N-acetyltransferase, partial [Acidobacteriota bacterium]|nr:GNAT family N-acetyltransferase [Acidobacteriota bacterium]
TRGPPKVPRGSGGPSVFGTMTDLVIRNARNSDRAWMAALLRERWGSTRIVTRGCVHDADRLSGFVAETGGKPIGLATYRLAADACEIVSLDSLRQGIGVGSGLIGAVCDRARKQACPRVWLITTNDNWPAMRFYLRRGFQFVAVHRGAVDAARRLKPDIAATGVDGIPITDEIEMELPL